MARRIPARGGAYQRASSVQRFARRFAALTDVTPIIGCGRSEQEVPTDPGEKGRLARSGASLHRHPWGVRESFERLPLPGIRFHAEQVFDHGVRLPLPRDEGVERQVKVEAHWTSAGGPA